MTIIINDCNGHYTKTWPNWDDVAASICNAIENNKHYHHKQD